MRSSWARLVAAGTLVFLAAGGNAAAQEDDAAFSLQLNTAQTVNESCRLTFVVENTSPDDIESSAFEMASFNGEGGFVSMSIFEFGNVLAGRTKVLQFDLAGLTCTDLSRIVINGAPQCSIGGTDTDFCFNRLATANLTDIELRPLPGSNP